MILQTDEAMVAFEQISQLKKPWVKVGLLSLSARMVAVTVTVVEVAGDPSLKTTS